MLTYFDYYVVIAFNQSGLITSNFHSFGWLLTTSLHDVTGMMVNVGISIPKWAKLFRVNYIHFSIVWLDYIYWVYNVPSFSKELHLIYLMDRAMNAAMCPLATHCMLSDSVQDLAVLLGPDADPPAGLLHWKCSAWHHYGHWYPLVILVDVRFHGWSILNHQLDFF